MIPYILHVTVIITVCFLFYKLFLQKETFYQLNRWTLVLCLAVAFTLPLLPAPRQWSWRNSYEGRLTSWLSTFRPGEKARAAAAGTSKPPDADPSNMSVSTRMATLFLPADQHRVVKPGKVAKKVLVHEGFPRQTVYSGVQPGVSQAKMPDRSVLGDPGTQPVSSVTTAARLQTAAPAIQSTAPRLQATAPAATSGIGLLTWLFYFYWFGVVVFGANFLLQIVILLYQSNRNPVIRDGRFRIVEVAGDRAPCSFGNSIFINPSLYDPETFKQILIHEKIHVSGRHTIDILLAEIVVVLQWFNPFAWLYRKEVENNLEFLTDQSVLQHREVERSAYQLSLLRVSAPHLPFSITTNYNQSLLKKRIVMMNSQHSSLRTVWKYSFLAPVLILLVCALNKPAVYGQSVIAGKSALHAIAIPDQKYINLSLSLDDAINTNLRIAIQPGLSQSINTKPDKEINNHTITTDLNLNINNNGSSLANRVASGIGSPVSSGVSAGVASSLADDDSGSPVSSPANVDLYSPDTTLPTGSGSQTIRPDENEGSWFVTTQTDGRLNFELKGETETHTWSNSMLVEKNEINPFPGQGNVTFKIVREAGTVTFTGQFDGQQGYGHYLFQPDAAFYNFIKQQGSDDLEERRLFSFFLVNMKKDFIAMVQRNGYPHASWRNLISLAAMHIDETFIQSWKKAGYADLSERDLITAKSMHLDPAYAQEMKLAGYDHLTMRELVTLKSQHIDGQYVRSLHAGTGNSLPPIHELITYKATNVDSTYLSDLHKLGYTELSYRDIISLNSMHITPEFIKQYQEIGYKNIPLSELRVLKSMDITPQFVKGFREVGYSDIQPRELSSLKSMGITPEFVQDFSKIGFKNIPVHELRSLKAMGVDAAYVSKMKEKGFDSQDLNKYIRLKRAFE